MIRVIKSDDRHHLNLGWLEARWHFSFGDYHDPDNLHFSSLRVFNDDWVAGGGGFDLHPHKDMEIITVMLEGALRHKDTMGHDVLLGPGEVQVMSAGRGITHGEFNDSPDSPLHLLQIWILPRTKGIEPKWAQKGFDPVDRQGKLQAVVSDGTLDGTLAINQDATIYLASLKAGQTVQHDGTGRSTYLFLIEGAASVNHAPLGKGDQARITEEELLEITTTDHAELLLIDLP